MRSVLLLAAAAALVAGCAADNRRFYRSDGNPASLDDQATYKDAYECKRDVATSAIAFSNSITAPAYARQMFIECMHARGYRYL